jgi:hypothetical protein
MREKYYRQRGLFEEIKVPKGRTNLEGINFDSKDYAERLKWSSL